MNKFEVGKTYRGNYKNSPCAVCLVVTDRLAILQVIDGSGHEYSQNHSLLHLYTEVKPKRVYEKWVCIYEDGAHTHWKSREEADEYVRNVSGRIACIHVRQEYEDGEGL